MAQPKVDRSKMNKKRLHDEASERLEAWQKLSPKEQLATLDERLGKDKGAAKQRARLNKLLSKEPG